MKKACEALQEKRLISDLSISVRVERTSDWSRNWERKVSGASLVMIHLMKNALKSSFWKDCKIFWIRITSLTLLMPLMGIWQSTVLL